MANECNREGTSIDWSFATTLPPRSPVFSGGGAALSDNNTSFFSNWPGGFPYPSGNRRHHQRTPSTSFLPQTLPWIDDLLNDTPEVPPRKSFHRRSSSDSVAPLQYASIDNIAEEQECDPRMVSRSSRGSKDLDRLDIGPFQNQQTPYSDTNPHLAASETRTPTMETPSTPSDHDSLIEHSMEEKNAGGVGQLKSEPEVQSAHKAEHTSLSAGKGEPLAVPNLPDTSLDPKRAKRILANRQSAQRSRVRKLQYIAELERSVNALQAEVSALSPQVAYIDRHRVVLNVDNTAMKQKLAALAQEKLFKDAHNEALKQEVHRLRQLYQQQRQEHFHQNLTFHTRQQQFTFPTSIQDGSTEGDISSDEVLRENEAGFAKSYAPPRSPLIKTIGPSSCVTGEKGRGVHAQVIPGIAPSDSDFRVHNP